MKDQSTQSNSRLGIVISMFPELHETFILRELVALEKRGLNFEIFSLQYPRDPITLDDALRLSSERTHYSSLLSFSIFSAFIRALFKQPGAVMRTLASVVWYGKTRPLDMLKNLAVVPLSMYIAEIGRKQGITHWHGHWANVPTSVCWYIGQVHGQSWSAAIHGEDIFSANPFLSRKLDDAVFCVVCSDFFCQHLKTHVLPAKPHGIHLNYHGLDPRVTSRVHGNTRAAQTTSDKISIVTIGRLVPTKGHDVLINACALLKDKDIPYSLQIIGSGPLEKQLKDQAAACGVSTHVKFHGALAFEEVLAILESADLFVLAPRLIPGQAPDGIPNVIAEAMALGVPVVSTRVSAIPELVIDGVNGVLIDVDDTVALADAIQDLHNDPALALQYSSAAREQVAKLFNQDANIDDLLLLFDRYVGVRPQKAVAIDT